ncbi:MAG: hypothetical protein LBD20_02130 [Spirochaetaceae bacterium]|jgi:hypothetical protein|nr:hypothetical protein [Spirochaetaceae bacterium]
MPTICRKYAKPVFTAKERSRKLAVKDIALAGKRAKAVNAVKTMQEISFSLGKSPKTLDEINAIISDVRTKK